MRNTPPPDFRYVWLLPGSAAGLREAPGGSGLRAELVGLGIGTLGLSTFGLALWSTGHQPISLAVTAASGVMAALLFARRHGPAPRFGSREVPMAIVPWGILVEPDGDMRVLRWPSIKRVHVDVTHTLRGGTPATIASLVTIETERERLAGRTFGSAGLERLLVHLEAYAEEAARPVALDLDGLEMMSDGVTEPIFTALKQAAEELVSTGEGASRLSLPGGTYRTTAARAATSETIDALRRALAAHAEAFADPRPFAAVVAALLDARELLPDLLALVSSPHPITAAVAKAAALRLGAPKNRAGSVEEIAAFLFPEDAELLKAWSERSV